MKNIELIDSHAHINFAEFGADLDSVLERAAEAGVKKIVCVGASLEGSVSSLKLAKIFHHIYATAGIHPHDAKDASANAFSDIRKLLNEDKIVAVGEVGLDYHYEHSPRETQKDVFRRFIAMALESKLPIVVHSRDAEEDTVSILQTENASKVGGVIHCFSGGIDMAEECMKMGFYISIPGIVTFKKAENIYEIARKVPIDRMLIETDSPYLAPIPFRGKRNEPSYVRLVADKIAELKGLSLEDVARITTRNAETLFDIADRKTKAEIAYKIRNSLYLNITNRCTNSCPFCPKFRDFIVKGHYLELEGKEPDTQEVIKAIGDPSTYKEVVFCGFGEPLLRVDVVREVSRWLKARSAKVRINTDGLANIANKRNILPELEGLIDCISVSLNADTPELYDRLCRPPFEGAFEDVKRFILEAKKYIPDVTASIVGLPSVNAERCREIAEKELGVNFRLRPYNEVG